MPKGAWSVQVYCINEVCKKFIGYRDIQPGDDRKPREECPDCARERRDRERPQSSRSRWNDDDFGRRRW